MSKRMYGGQLMTEEEIIAYREKKKLIMREIRADPVKRNKINKRRRERYIESGARERQMKYLKHMRETDFFKWRTRLFNGRFKTKYSVEDIKEIWDKQKSRCGLTGRELKSVVPLHHLQIGSAHLDHIIPIKRGGTHDLSNLRWVCSEANMAKSNLLDEEFLSLCKDVITFLGRRIMDSMGGDIPGRKVNG